jgi:hypothetical protein
MKRTSGHRGCLTLAGLLSLMLLPPALRAQQRNDYGEIVQTVARISYLSGDVSFSRGDDPGNWQPADVNVPMTLGDRVYTGTRSRLELQVEGGDVIHLGGQSDLAALNLTDDTRQFAVKAGIATFRIRDLADNETFEVDTPNSAVTFERPGDYRVDVDPNGNTRLSIRRGSALVAAGGGQIGVSEGEGIEVEGIDAPRYEYFRLASPDGWDQWVGEREARFARARSYHYVSADVVGADDLDDYGRWQQVPQYGWVWYPASVAADWVPYRVGHWIWQDPWGWTWVSAEPWGWAPYHYGRWVVVSSHWCWVPVAPAVRAVAYAPALVAFVGGGPGWSLTVSSGGGGFIGWFPLAPRDPFNPWWGPGAGTRVTTVTNVTYVNQTYVTVVNRNTFVSGGAVTSAVVRDRTVVQQVASAPVLRGPIPAVPTAGALRVAAHVENRAAPRPPAAVVARSVVARSAPPPAPPAFQAKLAVINQNHGAPVAPTVAARMSVENRGRPQTVTEVRPVATEQGRVTFAPRSGAATTERRVEPVAPSRGRPMATSSQPVAANPVTAPGRAVAPRQSLPPAEGAPAQPAPERGREAAPPAAQGERGRPQTEQARPTPAPQPIREIPPERRREALPPQEQAPPPQAAPVNPERRREALPPAQQPPPQAAPQKRSERPTPTPAPAPQRQAPPERGREAAPPRQQPSPPPVQERRREAAPPQQQPPPQPAPQERRERPTPVPAPQRQAPPERGREAAPPSQTQQPPPQQPERGRPAPSKPEEQKQKKEPPKENEPEKKPTPSS